MAKSIKAKKTAKASKPKACTVNWSDIFDSIWCITYTGYPERKKALESELKRIGILDSGVFNWRFTFPTIFDNILFDVTKKQLRHNNCKNVPSMSCSLGHYGCIKTAYELGHEFTLIMEDDIRFLKDVGKISEIMDSIPPCGDIINFDVLPTESKYTKDNYVSLMEKNSYNDRFFRYDGEMLWGASCYALSRKAMERILQRYEQMLYVADGYTSGKIFLGTDVSYFASKESMCCQLTFGKSVNVTIFGNNALHGVYSKKSLDYSKYNIFDKEGYTYGCSI
jgi:GR25 family glycosyltransferase involved in LPS biosynthesis